MSKRPSLWFTFVLLSVTGPLLAEFQFAEELFPELGQLIKLAASEGTEMQLNALRLEEREGDLDVTRGQRRPQVRAGARLAGAYETRDDIDNRFRGNINANLTMYQPLYHWGVLERRQNVAEERISLEGVDSLRRGERHFMHLRTAYLQWLLMKERLEILEQSVALSESFVVARRQLVEVGQSSEQDVLEMEARLLENYEAISYVEKNIVFLESSLSRLVGPGFRSASLSKQSLGKIEPMGADEFETLSRNIRTGLSDYTNPEMERFSLLSGIESDYLAILEKENHPKVDLVAGLLSDHLDSINNKDFVLRVQYYAGVQVNWSIFDGWQSNGRKRSTLARKRSFELQEQVAKDISHQAAETLLADLQLNLKQIEARSKRADILERRKTLVREQVELNILPGSELIELEINFQDVRQRLMEARVNYFISLMELGVLMGQDPARSYYQTES